MAPDTEAIHSAAEGSGAEEAQARPLFDFERRGEGSRRTLEDGRAAAETLLRRLNAPSGMAARLMPGPDVALTDEAAAAAADVGGLLIKFAVHVVLTISWYERRIRALRLRWYAVQGCLWGALVIGFALMLWFSGAGGGALSDDPNAWVPLLSAFGTFGFGLFQTVQTSTNQKGKLSGFRAASSALKTQLYELEDGWVDRLQPRRGEPGAAYEARLRDALLPELARDLEARIKTARKALRDEQAQSSVAEAAPDAFARGLASRATELATLLEVAPAALDPGKALRDARIAAAASAAAEVAKAELALSTATAELEEAQRLGASAETVEAHRRAVEAARISLAGRREAGALADAALG